MSASDDEVAACAAIVCTIIDEEKETRRHECSQERLLERERKGIEHYCTIPIIVMILTTCVIILVKNIHMYIPSAKMETELFN